MKLLENPNTHHVLVRELDTLVPGCNDPIVDENTRNLPYLNAVIYETLRLLPPAAGGKRNPQLIAVLPVM
jgi:cytochrome P450